MAFDPAQLSLAHVTLGGRRLGSLPRNVLRPDMQASLQAARDSGEAEELQPYLRFVLEQLPPDWDAPRSATGPPYQGLGAIDVELTAVRDPRTCAPVLAMQLHASDSDADAWAQHVSCVIKRGVIRHDALVLESVLQAVGTAGDPARLHLLRRLAATRAGDEAAVVEILVAQPVASSAKPGRTRAA